MQTDIYHEQAPDNIVQYMSIDYVVDKVITNLNQPTRSKTSLLSAQSLKTILDLGCYNRSMDMRRLRSILVASLLRSALAMVFFLLFSVPFLRLNWRFGWYTLVYLVLNALPVFLALVCYDLIRLRRSS